MIQELSNFITPAENEYLQLVSDQFQIVKNAIVPSISFACKQKYQNGIDILSMAIIRFQIQCKQL